jgi:1-acyl-sn-glycerol-3-phosphate acyltransferase
VIPHLPGSRLGNRPGHRAGVGADAERRLLPVPRASSFVRAVFWDQFLRLLVGGCGAAGEPPAGPAVVVANHSSHADTAALVAVLGKRASVLVVAGGDYWAGWRGRLAQEVVGILPISREGGFDALLAAAGEHLTNGGVVVIFPEGTRTTDGVVGRFRSGAVRLAAATGVPVVPAGIRGTRELYGKGRRIPRIWASRQAPLGVRIGEPVQVGDGDDVAAVTAALREAVCELAGPPAAPVSSSATWEWAQTRLSGWRGVIFTFGWAFAEGLSFPVVAEAGLLPVALAHGRRAVPAVAGAAAGSVAGVAANWALSRAGVRVPWPLTTHDMHAAACRGLERDVPTALRAQRGNGIPVKVYARTAGELGLPARTLLPAAAAARSSRIVPLGLGFAVIGQLARRRLRVGYGGVLAGSAIGVAIGLERVVRHWNRYR